MNYTQKQMENVCRHRSLFKVSARFNIFMYHHGESFEHNEEIAKQFVYLKSKGHYLAVRQPFTDNSVADVVILDLPTLQIKEICVSETKSRLKKKKYPGNIIEVRK